jgi:hypothetical protein
MRLKSQGVKPGTPDLFIMLDNGQTAWLELKSPKGRLSDHQLYFGAKAVKLGHRWAMVKSLDQAIEVFKAWKVLR